MYVYRLLHCVYYIAFIFSAVLRPSGLLLSWVRVTVIAFVVIHFSCSSRTSVLAWATWAAVEIDVPQHESPRQTPIRPQKDRFTTALSYSRASPGSIGRGSSSHCRRHDQKYQLAALVHLLDSAHLLMRTESDYGTLWSLAEAVCLPRINELFDEQFLLLPNQFCAYVNFMLVRVMVNSVVISLSIYTDVLFVLAQSWTNGMLCYYVWHQQFYSHAEVNDSYCIWHWLWWCKLMFVTRSSWQTILPLWHYRFMCWSDVVFFA